MGLLPFPFPVYLHGSCDMQQEATNKGIYNDAYIIAGAGDGDYFSTQPQIVLQQTMVFLYGIICENVLSTNDNKVNPTFQIFPNPAKQLFKVKLPVEVTKEDYLQIYNSTGILVKEIEISQETEIDISDLSDGLYFISLENHTAPVQKLIKQ